MAGDGAFTYDPPVGFTGIDTFGYTISDLAGATASAVVTVEVAELIWFVDNSAAAAGDGRLSSPFGTLGDVNSGTDADAPGDTIFVAETGTDYAGGIALENNQQLLGQGANLETDAGITFPPYTVTLPAAGTAPGIDGAPAVELASGNLVRGIAVRTAAGAGITGITVNTLVIDDSSIDAVGGPGLDLNGGTVSITLDAVSVDNASGRGVSLENLSGTTTFGSLDISNAGDVGFLASNAGTFNINSTAATVTTANGPAVDVNSTIGQTSGSPGWTFGSLTSSNSPSYGVRFAVVGQPVAWARSTWSARSAVAWNSRRTADVTVGGGLIDGAHTDGHGILLSGVTGAATIRGADAANRLHITRVGTTVAGLGGHSGIYQTNCGDLTVQFVEFDDIGSLGDEHGVRIGEAIPGDRRVEVTGSRFAQIGQAIPGNPSTGAGSGVDHRGGHRLGVHRPAHRRHHPQHLPRRRDRIQHHRHRG